MALFPRLINCSLGKLGLGLRDVNTLRDAKGGRRAHSTQEEGGVESRAPYEDHVLFVVPREEATCRATEYK